MPEVLVITAGNALIADAWYRRRGRSCRIDRGDPDRYHTRGGETGARMTPVVSAASTRTPALAPPPPTPALRCRFTGGEDASVPGTPIHDAPLWARAIGEPAQSPSSRASPRPSPASKTWAVSSRLLTPPWDASSPVKRHENDVTWLAPLSTVGDGPANTGT